MLRQKPNELRHGIGNGAHRRQKRFSPNLSTRFKRFRKIPKRWPNFAEHGRRYVFPRFPFSLIYQYEKDVVFVLAVAHHSAPPRILGRKIKLALTRR